MSVTHQDLITYIESHPMSKLLELKVEDIAEDRVVVKFPFKELIRIPGDMVHGGISMYVLDTVCWSVARLVSDTQVLTLELKFSFLEPLKGKEFRVIGKILKKGKRTIFTEGEIYNDKGKLCVKALGTFMKVG
ncbi:PaaI family thioesterase [Sulfolobus sp. S-194]|uniref:PaaI family thioesterase n=1 Tax=Sulfolobus sp. S-194 TaxID=2512240 RepID=UPI001437150C|nr:PaaI family thioesterase [Sulfolobus sp. S-194]QIW22886.1 PaaI family thioesterase [Sulfolobus sp. S-194]